MINNPARLTAKPIEHGILLSSVSVNIPREVKTNTIVKQINKNVNIKCFPPKINL